VCAVDVTLCGDVRVLAGACTVCVCCACAVGVGGGCGRWVGAMGARNEGSYVRKKRAKQAQRSQGVCG
jgi:hypothetical protein